MHMDPHCSQQHWAGLQNVVWRQQHDVTRPMFPTFKKVQRWNVDVKFYENLILIKIKKGFTKPKI